MGLPLPTPRKAKTLPLLLASTKPRAAWSIVLSFLIHQFHNLLVILQLSECATKNQSGSPKQQDFLFFLAHTHCSDSGECEWLPPNAPKQLLAVLTKHQGG